MPLDSPEENIPCLTTEQMREVDRAMMEDYGISLVQMMENAGRNLAHLARWRFLDGNPRNRRVLILAGTGGNGGGGLVCARRLHNWGADVKVMLSAQESKLTEVPWHQLGILKRMGMKVDAPSSASITLSSADLVIDALIGYSLRGAPSGTTAQLILAAAEHGAPILSLDVPSGIDTATGVVHEPAIRATATLTLALPKEGLRSEQARQMVGELFLADISVPPELYAGTSLGLDVGPIFAKEDVVRVW